MSLRVTVEFLGRDIPAQVHRGETLEGQKLPGLAVFAKHAGHVGANVPVTVWYDWGEFDEAERIAEKIKRAGYRKVNLNYSEVKPCETTTPNECANAWPPMG